MAREKPALSAWIVGEIVDTSLATTVILGSVIWVRYL